MGFIVEFVGLPGAGKSTLARALVAELRILGVPTTDVMARIGPEVNRPSRIRRKTSAIFAGLTEPGSLGVAAVVARAQRQGRDRVARPANLLVVRHAVTRAHSRRGVHVLDQGPLQEWWSAALWADDTRVLRRAAEDRTARSNLLVFVETPGEVLADRLAARGVRQSRLERLAGPALAEEMRRGERLMAVLVEQWVDCPTSPAGHLLRIAGVSGNADLVVSTTQRLVAEAMNDR